MYFYIVLCLLSYPGIQLVNSCFHMGSPLPQASDFCLYNIWLHQIEKQIYRLNSRPQIWSSGLILAMTSILDLKGQIFNSRVLEMAGLIDVKSKRK